MIPPPCEDDIPEGIPDCILFEGPCRLWGDDLAHEYTVPTDGRDIIEALEWLYTHYKEIKIYGSHYHGMSFYASLK